MKKFFFFTLGELHESELNNRCCHTNHPFATGLFIQAWFRMQRKLRIGKNSLEIHNTVVTWTKKECRRHPLGNKYKSDRIKRWRLSNVSLHAENLANGLNCQQSKFAWQCTQPHNPETITQEKECMHKISSKYILCIEFSKKKKKMERKKRFQK